MLKIYEIVTYASGVLHYVSATLNPILYHIMSHKFREAFKVSCGQTDVNFKILVLRVSHDSKPNPNRDYTHP